MKNEDGFNAYLAKELKRLAPETAVLKMCEKYHIGVADFMLVRGGEVAFFETKFLKACPQGKTSYVLAHPFSGAQLTFLRTMKRAGALAWGVVYHAYCGMIHVYDSSSIPEKGNWFDHEFGWGGEIFSKSDVAGLAHYMLTGQRYHIMKEASCG